MLIFEASSSKGQKAKSQQSRNPQLMNFLAQFGPEVQSTLAPLASESTGAGRAALLSSALSVGRSALPEDVCILRAKGLCCFERVYSCMHSCDAMDGITSSYSKYYQYEKCHKSRSPVPVELHKNVTLA